MRRNDFRQQFLKSVGEIQRGLGRVIRPNMRYLRSRSNHLEHRLRHGNL